MTENNNEFELVIRPQKGLFSIDLAELMHYRVGSLLEVGTGFHPELTGGRENIYFNGVIQDKLAKHIIMEN